MRTPPSVLTKLAGSALAAACLGAALQACATLTVTPSPDARFDLHVDNGTTLPIAIVLDGHPTTVVAPQTSSVVSLQSVPHGIVDIEARRPDGKAVITFAIDPSTLSSVTSGSVVDVTGAAHRADLSCGRLDLWLLTPLLGPSRGAGTPGDCGSVEPSASPSSS